MSIFDIIDNVDWNKNIIFLVLYITIVVLCIFIYLVPLMDNYKSVIMEYRKTNILDSQINSTLDRLKGSEEDILKDNAAVFERLHSTMNVNDLQKYARTHIKGAKVEDLGIMEVENGIKIHSFKIMGQTHKLANVKKLLANVKDIKNSVRIAFPITISKNEKRNMLEFEITLMVYNSTRDISTTKNTHEEGEFTESTKLHKTSTKKSSNLNYLPINNIQDSNNSINGHKSSVP